MKAVQIGVHATLMILITGALFLLLPGDEPISPWQFLPVLLAAALGAWTIWRLPWESLLESGKALYFFHAWSALNIVLIGVAIGVTGGGRSPLYPVYGLTTIFFGMVFRPRAQLSLLGLTIGSYIGVLWLTGWDISPAVLTVRIGFFLTLAYLGSFLARELLAQMDSQRNLGLHDGLTRLPNRRLLQDRADQAIAVARRRGNAVLMMMIDLSRFKEINDTLGHRNGDLFLKQVAARLQMTMREYDTVARVGGDEFAVLVPEVPGIQAAAHMANRVREALHNQFVVEGFTLEAEASIGISVYPDHGEDADTLLQKADIAMYRSKEQHKAFEVYDAEHDRHSTARLQLLNDLKRAVERNELTLHYQPKVNMATGEVLGAEALVRWDHPLLGQVLPSTFIPLAEQSAAITRISRFVLSDALRQASEWRAGGHHLRIAVNLSARDLLDQDFIEHVANVLEESGFPPESVELEITEGSLLADPEKALAMLQRLKSLGVCIALDDFGTGYSSLAHLRDLPVDVIKIDKGFVAGMAINQKDAAIVRSTIDLARNLEMDVVAEGVESAEVCAQLMDLGCSMAQGFHFARPVPTEDFVRYLENGDTGKPRALKRKAPRKRAS